jgi:hypothetical protein
LKVEEECLEFSFALLCEYALGRFRTPLEQRCSKKEVTKLLGSTGFDLSTLKFSDVELFWTFSEKNFNPLSQHHLVSSSERPLFLTHPQYQLGLTT